MSNSTIEYIRQLNQASVHLQADWLERLKHVEAGIEAQVATPEIVLTASTEIAKYTEGNFDSPVVMVKRTEDQPLAQAAAPIQQPTVAPLPVPPSPQISEARAAASTLTNSIDSATDHLSANSTVDVSACLDSSILDAYGSGAGSIDSNQIQSFVNPDLVPKTPLAQATLRPRETVAPSMNEITPEAAADLPPATPAPTGNENTAVGSNVTAQVPTESSANVQPKQIELESPAILNDIVRPTIMPLRHRQGTDVIDSGPASDRRSPPVVQSASEPSIGEPPIAESPEPVAAATPAAATVEETPQKSIVAPQMIEMLSDFGMSGNEIHTSDTLSPEEVAGLINQPTDESAIEAKDDESIDAIPTSRSCSFPTDKRAERFIYEKTKRQKLVDSIVDQIVERFPAESKPVIMLIGANREIDVDSAASRVATCIASRDIGDVLLVDANLHTRQLTSVLALATEPGISDAFENKQEAIDLIVHTDSPRLKIIGAGSVVGPDEDSAFPAAAATNTCLKERFDYTIVSGGIGGDLLTDSWSAIVDGVYLIVDMDESDRNTTMVAVDYFRKLGARIVGCIATRA